MGILSFLFGKKKEKSLSQIRQENNLEVEKIHEITKRAVYRNFGEFMIEKVGINPLMFGMMNDRIDAKTAKIMESNIFDLKNNPNSRIFFDTIKQYAFRD